MCSAITFKWVLNWMRYKNYHSGFLNWSKKKKMWISSHSVRLWNKLNCQFKYCTIIYHFKYIVKLPAAPLDSVWPGCRGSAVSPAGSVTRQVSWISTRHNSDSFLGRERSGFTIWSVLTGQRLVNSLVNWFTLHLKDPFKTSSSFMYCLVFIHSSLNYRGCLLSLTSVSPLEGARSFCFLLFVKSLLWIQVDL